MLSTFYRFVSILLLRMVGGNNRQLKLRNRTQKSLTLVWPIYSTANDVNALLLEISNDESGYQVSALVDWTFLYNGG